MPLSSHHDDPILEQIARSEEHTSELQSHVNLVCRHLLEKKKLSSTSHFRRSNLCSIRPCAARRHPIALRTSPPHRTASCDPARQSTFPPRDLRSLRHLHY